MKYKKLKKKRMEDMKMSTFNRNEEVQIYNNAINLRGEAIQTIVAIEECNELILALTNLRCGKPSNVEEETADVEIMINQLCIINDIELFEDMPVKPVEVNVACLSSELIIALTELVQAITKGIRGKETDIKGKLIKAWGYLMFLKAVLGDEVDRQKEFKLKRLKNGVCM